MKTIFTVILMLFVQATFAQKNTSHDFGRSTSELKELSTEELSYRLYIRGEILIFNKDGSKLTDLGNEYRTWEFNGLVNEPLISYWSYEQKGLPAVALKHEWKLLPTGQIEFKIDQYDKMERSGKDDVKVGKLIKSDQQILRVLSSYDLEVPSNQDRKIIVRLTPALWPHRDILQVSDFPISTKDVLIHDSEGQVWAISAEGDRASKYFGVSTHKGTLMLSYHPFKGAVDMGKVKGGQMKLKVAKMKVYLMSQFPFVPRDIEVKVYGKYIPERKTDRLNSVRTFTSNKEEEFLKAVQ